MFCTNRLKAIRTEGLVEGLGLTGLLSFISSKALRGGPRLLPQIAACVLLLLVFTKFLPARLSDIAYGSYTKIMKWRPQGGYSDDVAGGLRIVVFGGGSVATPNQGETQHTSWTEELCRQLECSEHISYVPPTEAGGGPVVSNVLYDAALTHMANLTLESDESSPGLNYSWLPEQYPIPAQPDLQQQMDNFLASSPPGSKPRETLWVFDYGYWDIWRLASLPRDVAKDVIDVQTRHIFAQVEVLYQEALSDKSVASSDYYTFLNTSVAPSSDDSGNVVVDVPAEPFRVLIPHVFDISLAPGFDISRFQPPAPHSRAEETKNAAYLTDEWNKQVNSVIDSWLATPDPVANATANVTGGMERRDMAGNVVYVPYAKREAITYDASTYLEAVIIDRQLRNAEVTDKKGLGTMPTEEGFLEVWSPCVSFFSGVNATTAEACEAPHEHLFWTEYTLGQRAMTEIGKQAADLFKKHVHAGVQWLAKAKSQRRRWLLFKG